MNHFKLHCPKASTLMSWPGVLHASFLSLCHVCVCACVGGCAHEHAHVCVCVCARGRALIFILNILNDEISQKCSYYGSLQNLNNLIPSKVLVAMATQLKNIEDLLV